MEENVNLQNMGEPQPLEEGLPSDEPTAISDEDKTDSAFLEVKFNKELKRLTLDEATTLAQKGMKFEMIAEDIDRLSALSKGEGLSMSDYITRLTTESRERRLKELSEKCSGDTLLAEKLLEAEGVPAPDDSKALLAEFPDLEVDAIPDEVKTAAEIKGTGLLFEYLLYEHHLRRAAAEELSRRKTAEEAALGSLSSGSSRSAVDAEFLKGVWGR